MHFGALVRNFICYVVWPCVLFATLSTATTAGDREPVLVLQDMVDGLKARLDLPVEVTVALVPTNPLLVSVSPVRGRTSFQMSFEEGFLDRLSGEELRTIVAHELGHVWIYTHFPYLQTERGANEIALRVVSRESLEDVYGKVWSRKAVKMDLAKYLPATR